MHIFFAYKDGKITAIMELRKIPRIAFRHLLRAASISATKMSDWLKVQFAAAAGAAGAVAGKYMPGCHIRGEWSSSEYAWNERKKMLDYSDK